MKKHRDIDPLFRLFGVMVFCLLALPCNLDAQTAPGKYRIEFTDKRNTVYRLDTPGDFLSQKAIERRQKQGILPDSLDLPVNQVYLDSLKKMGFRIHGCSKWFNAATIIVPDPSALAQLGNISFIRSTLKVRNPGPDKKSLQKQDIITGDLPYTPVYQEYGFSQPQVWMMNGHHLHAAGYMGEKTRIAIIDAGYTGIDNLPSFIKIRDEGRIVASRDFVDGDHTVNHGATHGTVVFSIIAAWIPGEMIGTAPGAEFILLRSEDGQSEFIVEEDNWISAAEFADSAGADVINTSLGYSVFDDPAQDHSYEDMDGKTTRISRGATIAASRGMVVVTSAGNAGDKPWQYITAPADAGNILSVGAVDPGMRIAGFSSRGPSYDGRIKPEVVAIGQGTVIQDATGIIRNCNGTSCSAPLVSGLAACLWQAFPEAGSGEIVNSIIRSASQYNRPDTIFGYGIPDFRIAYRYLYHIHNTDKRLPYTLLAYPNPFQNELVLELYDDSGSLITDQEEYLDVSIYSITGQKVCQESISTHSGPMPFLRLHPDPLLGKGSYILVITTGSGRYHTKIMKF